LSIFAGSMELSDVLSYTPMSAADLLDRAADPVTPVNR
jgi:hypothetical protein